MITKRLSSFQTGKVRLNISIDKELKKKLHKKCVEEEIDMSEHVSKLIEKDLKVGISGGC